MWQTTLADRQTKLLQQLRALHNFPTPRGDKMLYEFDTFVNIGIDLVVVDFDVLLVFYLLLPEQSGLL